MTTRLEPNPLQVREIVIPHDPDAGPVTAVKNLLLQFSLAQLKAHGLYDTYAKLIAPEVLTQLLAQLGPGWVPVEFAMAHYEACDRLNLDAQQIDGLGKTVGDRIQNTALISAAKRTRDADFDVWDEVGSLHRMWSRLYQGGSVQISKLGPKDQLIERRGYPMNRFRYYRQAQLGVFTAAYAAFGIELTRREIRDIKASEHEVMFWLSWA
jgi:hypothetical protein